MDFHSLSRKELQTLCKKNKTPANITNVAMADALSALPQVEGLDEFLNPTEAEAGAGTPDTTHRTACRASTRRKALREEPQSSKVVSSQRPQRGARAGRNGEGLAEQENKDANVLPVTPAARRRATAVSSRRAKKEAEMIEDDEKNGNQGKPIDVPKTPAAVPSSRTRATGRSVCTKTEGASVQRAYNTRRSVRLLEKNLSKMSLMDTEDTTGLDKIDDVSEETSSVSQLIEDSADTEEVCDAGVSLSNVVSEETDELEVSSLEKKTEYECHVHGSDSEVNLVSEAEIDVGAGLEAEPQKEDSNLKAESEPHDSNLKLEGSSETHEGSNEVLESYGVSDVDMNKSIGETVHADDKAGSELLSELEDSCDSSEAENKECLGTKQEALSVEASEDASLELTEQDVAAVTVEEVADQDIDVEASEDASMEFAELDVAALTIEVTEDASIEVTDQDIAVEASEEASMEFTEEDVAALTVEAPDDASIEITDQDVAGLPPMSPGSDDSARLKEFLDCNIDNQGGDDQDKNNETEHLNVEPMKDVDEKAADEIELGSSNICSSGEHQEEESEVKLENSEESLDEVEKKDNSSDVICAFSAIASEKDNANASSEDSIDVIEVRIETSADESTNGENFTLQSSLLDDHQEELEAKSEHLEEESMVEVEKVIDGASDVTGASSAIYLEKDASSENSIAVAVCTESSADVKSVTLESSLGDGVVQEADEQKDDSDKLEARAQPEESNDHAAAEATAFDALVSAQSFNSNTLVEGDVVSEEVVVPNQGSCVSAETLTVAPIHELKSSDIPMQSVVADNQSLWPAQSETKGNANEIQTVPKMISIEDNMHNAANMKENLTTDELHRKSMRELKMMLKKLKLEGKSNCKSKTNNVVKEVERKRNALQALPENQMTKGAAQHDG